MTDFSETSYKGMYKVSLDGRNRFYIRREYVDGDVFENLENNIELTDEQIEQLENASLICAVELKAVEYLARAEQSRFGLRRKLIQKKYDSDFIEKALDFLEDANYLSDERYAKAWLNSRRINHSEGKQKLFSELLARGISRDVSLRALEDFFAENDEDEICVKAYKKAVRNGKTGEKLIAALVKSGFSLKQIRIAEEKIEAEKVDEEK